jgi:DNA polymerase-3 subunit alpha
MEKDVMGIYVSDHPLRGHEATIAAHSTSSAGLIPEAEEGSFVKIAGVIAKFRTIVTKNEGKRMATLVLEDFTGQIGAIAFPATFEKLRNVLTKDAVVEMSGYVMHREMRGEKSIEIRIEDVVPLEPELNFANETSTPGKLKLVLNRVLPSQAQSIRDLIESYPGEYQVQVQVEGCVPWVLPQHVTPSDDLISALKPLLLRGDVSLEHNEWSERPAS